MIIQSGRTFYQANFSSPKESRIANYQNRSPIAFIKGVFPESSGNSEKGKQGEKAFNLFPAGTTLRPVQQDNLSHNIAACNDQGIIPTTVIRLIYRLTATGNEMP